MSSTPTGNVPKVPTGIVPNVIQPIQKVVAEASELKGETKYIGYMCKIFNESVAIVAAAGKACLPLTKAIVYTSGFSAVVGLFKTVGHASDFLCPEKASDKYKWQTGGSWSKAATAANVLLTGADILDPLFFLTKIGAFSLGVVAAPLQIAKGVMMLGASTLGIYEDSSKLHANDKMLKNFEAKKGKWKKIDELADSEVAEKVNLYAAKLLEQDANPVPKKAHNVAKWAALVAGADENAKIASFKAIAASRVTYLEDVEKTVKNNHYIKRTVDALSLTTNITMFALGIIGLVGAILALSGVGIAAAPAFVIACAAGWLATHILLLTKDLYRNYNEATKILPQEFTPIAA